ncbi:hypothetical protein TRP8649_03243 [Pelagimonas phthalicica]|uniref:Uncharacterized protein n=1 Tax=Pelagimonas phthalicica TaxID=1037362 RepID=A0A238JGP5_9RHOB|nr:hypothetical protein [Pelagimonas phthalicica]TDS92062.1 hypothetical protein CLV87_3244 [Pelagimonas phthalicica]SMX29112.1 hypothetical protein TRP8649_03243 [Pelagimonas phthalicica]
MASARSGHQTETSKARCLTEFSVVLLSVGALAFAGLLWLAILWVL